MKNRQSKKNELPDLVIDDDPIESVINGEAGGRRTPASLFARAREFVNWVQEAHRAGDLGTVIDLCKILAASDIPISLGMCSELASLLSRIVPQCPNPALRHDLASLCPLLRKIWTMAAEKRDVRLQRKIAAPAYRCHEHYGQFAEAQKVLAWLLDRSRRTGDRDDEAIYLNNLGFEYQLEGRFQEAIQAFEKAANLFENNEDPIQHANSRANYWLGKLEASELKANDEVVSELKLLTDKLTRRRSWQARKPMILLAHIAEQKGKLEESIRWVEKAIETCEGSGTRYPETDAEYLQRLHEKRAAARESSSKKVDG